MNSVFCVREYHAAQWYMLYERFLVVNDVCISTGREDADAVV